MENRINVNSSCTACCACVNICPNDAIYMKEDEYGFLYPHIDNQKCSQCGLCKSVCNNRFLLNINMYKNSLAVQVKNWELSKKSSSGGVFAILSKYILSKNGIVFGCSMEKKENTFEINHISIEKLEDICKLQGSKYVQSDIGYSYKRAKEYLEQKRLVLFSGTPCQIAGLKSYLKKDYENLFCIDLSCTGTPSKKMFQDYISLLEKKYNKKISNFDFRNKEKLGWSCGNAFVTFNDKSEKILYNNLSSYLSFFMQGISERESCYSCEFTGLRRISDITLCDCWGIDYFYPKLLTSLFKKNKGISLILINSEKGNMLFEKIKNSVFSEEVNVNKLKKCNHPLIYPSKKHPYRKEYMNIYKKNGYIAADTLFFDKMGIRKYYYMLKNITPNFIKNIIKNFILKNNQPLDCMLMTAFGAPNYGSVLAAYALQKTIDKLGYSNKILYSIVAYSYAKEFAKKYLNLTKKIVTLKDYIKLNEQTKAFILGSDNLINLATSPLSFVARNLFNYSDENKKLLMISASMGSWDGTCNNEEDYNYIKSLFKRFDYIATREYHAKNVIENVFHCDADWINDPVMYLEKEDYLKLIKNSTIDYSNCIVQYILYPNSDKIKILEFLQQKYGYKIVKFDANENVNLLLKQPSVENWLSAIKNSKIIVTDSFHCMCFAFIFNKPFICLKNKSNPVRFESLFKILGVDIKPINKVDEINESTLEYDYDRVNFNLKKIRENALNKIKENLEKNKQLTEEQKETEKLFQIMNQTYLKKTMPKYKQNKLLFLTVIEPIIIPLIKIIKYLQKCKKY